MLFSKFQDFPFPYADTRSGPGHIFYLSCYDLHVDWKPLVPVVNNKNVINEWFTCRSHLKVTRTFKIYKLTAKMSILLILTYTQILKVFYLIQEFYSKVQQYLRISDWYVWVHMDKGQITMPIFQSLDAYWPGLQVSDSCQLFADCHAYWIHQIMWFFTWYTKGVSSVSLFHFIQSCFFKW